MNKTAILNLLAVGLLLGAGAGTAGAQEVPSIQVTAMRGVPDLFDQRDGQFVRRDAPAAPVNLVGATVLEESARGYVQLQVPELGEVWVQRMRVDYPRQPLRARCLEGISASGDALHAGSRGAGQGCAR